MAPTLLPGDRLLVDPRPDGPGWPPLGAIVVVRDPEHTDRQLIKRVSGRADPAGAVTVAGDAAGPSRDSRAFGPVPLAAVLGVAWFRYLPRDRRGYLEGTASNDLAKL